MSITNLLMRTQNSMRRAMTALRRIREGMETGSVAIDDRSIIEAIEYALTGEKIEPESTAYLIAWIHVTAKPVVIGAVGIYSEPSPTADAHWFPVVLTEMSAPTYQEANDNLVRYVNDLPEWNPYARMISGSSWHTHNGKAPVFSVKPEEYAVWLREEGMRIEPYLELTAGRKFDI